MSAPEKILSDLEAVEALIEGLLGLLGIDESQPIDAILAAVKALQKRATTAEDVIRSHCKECCSEVLCEDCFIALSLVGGKVAPPASPSLDWSESHDHQDNTTYEAPGPYQELDGTVFYYRIHPVLRDNAVWYSTHNSDAELIPAAEAEEFRTLAEAKADCQRRHDALRAELARGEG